MIPRLQWHPAKPGFFLYLPWGEDAIPEAIYVPYDNILDIDHIIRLAENAGCKPPDRRPNLWRKLVKTRLVFECDCSTANSQFEIDYLKSLMEYEESGDWESFVYRLKANTVTRVNFSLTKPTWGESSA